MCMCVFVCACGLRVTLGQGIVNAWLSGRMDGGKKRASWVLKMEECVSVSGGGES